LFFQVRKSLILSIPRLIKFNKYESSVLQAFFMHKLNEFNIK